MGDRERGYDGHFGFINFIKFSVICLEKSIGFRGLQVYWHCPFSCTIKTVAIAAILISSLIFYYWNNVLEAVMSDLLTFWVTLSAEGCLSACTVFLAHPVEGQMSFCPSSIHNLRKSSFE